MKKRKKVRSEIEARRDLVLLQFFFYLFFFCTENVHAINVKKTMNLMLNLH